MKKGYTFGALIALALIFASSFASAYYYLDIRGVTQSVIDAYVGVGEPILSALFGGYGGWSGFLLFERFLLFILLLSVIYVVSGRVPLFEEQKQKPVRWIIAIIIPLIAMRFIDYSWLEVIITQYKLISVILMTILPFVIFFFFIHGIGKDYPILRKVGWLVFIGVYVGLWSTAEGDFEGAIFFWTVVAAVLFLIFDGRIERYLRMRDLMSGDRSAKWREIGRINMEIQELHRQIASTALPPAIGNAEIAKLTKVKTELARTL